MEVHAHAYTERKRLRHYLFEFFMLFLAVFCGFLAENFREHQIEKQRGKKYIVSFYEDLVKDTAGFVNVIKSFEEKNKVFASRKECYNNIMHNKDYNCIADLFRHSEFFSDLVYTDATLQQLKNAGGLRLLKKADADSVLSYDNLLRAYIRIESTGFQDRQNKLRDIIYSIANYAGVIDSNFHASPIFDVKNMEAVNHYFVMLDAYANAIGRVTETLRAVKNKAVNLINYFKKEYDIK